MTQNPSPTASYSPSDRLALLSRLAQEFNASRDPDELLKRVMDEVIEATHAERGFLILVEPVIELEQPIGYQPLNLLARVARGIDHTEIDSPAFQFSRSVVEQVLRQGHAVITSDAQQDGRFSARQSVISLKLRSILCVPMRVRSHVIGAIYVDNRIQAGIFSQPDLELLLAIASTAAIAIENARLFRSVQDNLRSLRLLHKVSEDLTSTLDLDRVLTFSVQAVQELLGATAASILKIEGDELVFQIALGEKASEVKPFRIPRNKGVAGWVIEHLQPTIVNDVDQDARFYTGTDRQSGFKTKSLAAAPLVVNDRPIGVLEVFNKPGGFQQADLDLLSTFASASAIALENARLYAEAVEKGRMERELQMARRVQNSLLPQRQPTVPGWEFATQWLPARQVGGDYYDFVPLEKREGEPESIGLVIADVTDKGTPAALFMANARSTVRAASYSAHSIVEGIQNANRLISADSFSSMFITLFFGRLNLQSGELTYVNAGHNPPLLCPCGTEPGAKMLSQLKATGLPLGIDGDARYSQETVQLGHGDFIVCYTDGVTDALNPREEPFGMQRLEAALQRNRPSSAAGLLAALEQELLDFIATRDRYDDITILIAHRL